MNKIVVSLLKDTYVFGEPLHLRLSMKAGAMWPIIISLSFLDSKSKIVGHATIASHDYELQDGQHRIAEVLQKQETFGFCRIRLAPIGENPHWPHDKLPTANFERVSGWSEKNATLVVDPVVRVGVKPFTVRWNIPVGRTSPDFVLGIYSKDMYGTSSFKSVLKTAELKQLEGETSDIIREIPNWAMALPKGNSIHIGVALAEREDEPFFFSNATELETVAKRALGPSTYTTIRPSVDVPQQPFSTWVRVKKKLKMIRNH